MGESSERTIQFLRARLSAERSLSKSAEDRADQMAKKVLELEEQLKLVTLQRTRAEKATSEVLAILENHGISDISEVFDSSSDHEEIGNESKEVDVNEGAGSTISSPTKMKAKSSGSDPREFPLISRSLSWKNCSSSPTSVENAKFLEEGRRCISIVSTGGSYTKHRLGKSCRQMKQRKTRSAEPLLSDTQVNVDVTNSVYASNLETVTAETMKAGRQIEGKKEYFDNIVQDPLDYQRKDANDVSGVHGIKRNVEMERALEHQACRRGEFEAEENAQREWEEKYKENKCYSSDSVEQGNQSDITEERDEIREEPLEAASTIPSHEQEGKSRKQQAGYNGEPVSRDFTGGTITKNLPSRYPPHQYHDIGYPHEQKHVNSTLEPQNRGILEAQSNERRKQEWLEKNSFYPANSRPPQHQVAPISSVHVENRSGKGESSQTSSSLGGVLYALQQAKLSIKQELQMRGSPTGGKPVVRSAASPVSAITAGNFMEIPVPSAGLSGVPSRSEPNSNILVHYPDSGSTQARYYTGLAVGSSFDDRYTDKNSVNSVYRAAPIDPYMDKGIGLPSTNFLYPSYIDLMPRMSSKDEVSRPNPVMGLGTTAEDRHLDYTDHLRLDMYKR